MERIFPVWLGSPMSWRVVAPVVPAMIWRVEEGWEVPTPRRMLGLSQKREREEETVEEAVQ